MKTFGIISFILLMAAAITIAARPDHSYPGDVTVTPDPVTAGAVFTISGSDIPDDGSGGVWLAIAGDPETCTAGTSFIGDLLEADGTFSMTWTLYTACTYTVDVYEGYGGSKAKKLATTTFTVQ